MHATCMWLHVIGRMPLWPTIYVQLVQVQFTCACYHKLQILAVYKEVLEYPQQAT